MVANAGDAVLEFGIPPQQSKKGGEIRGGAHLSGMVNAVGERRAGKGVPAGGRGCAQSQQFPQGIHQQFHLVALPQIPHT